MGCVATKTEITNILKIKSFDKEEISFNSSMDRTTLEDSQAVSDSFSQSLKETISPSKSGIIRVSNRPRRNSKKSLLNDPNGQTYRLIIPALDELDYEIFCVQKKIPIFIHLMNGFPSENVEILSIEKPEEKKPLRTNWLKVSSNNNRKQKQLNGVWPKAKNINLVLRPNVSIFIKLNIECVLCSKITRLTHCRAVFPVCGSNCNCKSDKVKVRIIKSQPELIQIWSDNLKKVISQQMLESAAKQTDVVLRRKSKLRVFGCTSCWGFSNLTKRRNCPCAVCNKCQLLPCNICSQ